MNLFYFAKLFTTIPIGLIHRKSILYLSNNFVCITVYGEIRQDVKGINIIYLKMHIQVFFKLMIYICINICYFQSNK